MEPGKTVDDTHLDPRSPRPFEQLAPVSVQVGRYELVGILGRGGMGEVLQVRDPDLNRDVALKRMRPDVVSPRALDAFLLEAQVTGQLEHPNIVPLHELGREPDGRRYFTLKRVEGRTLDQILHEERQAGPVTVSRTLGARLETLIKVCDAVSYAHHKGVLHRDLKPSNVMVGAFGEVLVMDWGLAKLVGSPEPDRAPIQVDVEVNAHDVRTFATLDGEVLGTPTYMAPEQAAGRIALLDARSDVYALGAILYEILTLCPPFDGRTMSELLAQVKSGRLTAPRARAPGREIPRELEAVALRAMALDPDARYSDASSLAADLRTYVEGGLLQAARYTVGQRIRKWARRHRGGVLGAAVALGVTLAFAGWHLREHLDRQAEHRALLHQARQRISALESEPRLAQAERASLALATPRRLKLTMLELLEQGRELVWLRELAGAYAALLELEPALEVGRSGRVRVLLALGRLATLTEEYALAEFALGEAVPLEPPGGSAAIALEGVRAERLARTEDHVESVRRRLAQARAGTLERGADYQAALVELAGYQERETVDILVAELEGLTADLRAAASNALSATGLPTDDERRAGWQELPDLAAHVERWFAAQAPNGAASPATSASRELDAKVAPARGRLVIRAARTRGRDLPVLGWREILSAAQRAELERAGRGERVLALTCDALGLLGDPVGTEEPLASYLWIEEDEVRAVAAGRALAALAVRSPRARELVLELVGLAPTQVRPPRWQVNGTWWTQVRSALAGTPPESDASLATAAEHHRRGQVRASTGDVEGAIRDYTRAIELDPVFAPARADRGAARLASDPRAALADLDQALALDANLAIAFNNRGRACQMTGDVDGALTDYARAIELAPDFALAYCNRARLREARGSLVEALRDYEQTIALDGASAIAHNGRGVVLQQLGDADGALVAFARSIELDPRHAASWCNRGGALRARGDLDAALGDFSQAISLDPGYAQAYRDRGATWLARGDLTAARRDYDQAIALDPSFARAYNGRGLVRNAAGELDGAIEDFTRAIELEPGFADPHANRGTARIATGDLPAAIGDYRRATEVRPASSALHQRLGTALRLAGRLDESLASLERALALDARSGGAHNAIGQTHEARSNLDAAIASFQRAVELDPRHASAWRNLSGAQRQAKDLDGAIASSATSIELEPLEPRGYTLRGLALKAKGEFGAAIADYDRAIGLDPRNAPAHRSRARAKEAQGDIAGALVDAETLLVFDRKAWSAWELKAQLLLTADRRPEAAEALRQALALAPSELLPRIQAQLEALDAPR